MIRQQYCPQQEEELKVEKPERLLHFIMRNEFPREKSKPRFTALVAGKVNEVYSSISKRTTSVSLGYQKKYDLKFDQLPLSKCPRQWPWSFQRNT